MVELNAHDSPLELATPAGWIDVVIADFDSFLQDHAAAEKKASGMAISMLSHYPDKIELVSTMADLAVEELAHYREVVKWIHARGLVTAADAKDPYVNQVRQAIRKGAETLLLDRLLTASIIEARGAERFAIVAKHLEDGALKDFYLAIAKSEERHYLVFLELAKKYAEQEDVEQRFAELLSVEAQIVKNLPLRAALH